MYHAITAVWEAICRCPKTIPHTYRSRVLTHLAGGLPDCDARLVSKAKEPYIPQLPSLTLSLSSAASALQGCDFSMPCTSPGKLCIHSAFLPPTFNKPSMIDFPLSSSILNLWQPDSNPSCNLSTRDQHSFTVHQSPVINAIQGRTPKASPSQDITHTSTPPHQHPQCVC